MSKFKLVLGLVVVAGATALIFFQHRAQQKLRAENEFLRRQMAQFKSEMPDASADQSRPMTDEDFNELLRLRGQVSTLRAQTNELQEQKQRLQQTLVTAHKAHPADTNTALGHAYFTRQYQTAELAIAGLLNYASNHDNNLPATFDQAASFYTPHMLATNLSGFVITYQGSLTNIANPSDAIVVQSFQPFIEKELNRDGFTNEIQTRIYGFANGYVTGHGVALDGNLEEWEQKHLPVLKDR